MSNLTDSLTEINKQISEIESDIVLEEIEQLDTSFYVKGTVTDDYSIFDSPSSFSNRIGKILKGQELKLFDFENGFWYVKNEDNAITGYFDSLFLEETDVVKKWKEILILKGEKAILDREAKEAQLREEREKFKKAEKAKDIQQGPEIRLVYLGSPNSAGGVDVDIIWANKTNKRVKYAYFTLTPYNKVDDKCYSQIGQRSTTIIKAIGPYEMGIYKSEWENIWYNHSISYCILTKVSFEYMDGTRKDVTGLKVKSTDDILLYFDYNAD